jgi:hypothetical protein
MSGIQVLPLLLRTTDSGFCSDYNPRVLFKDDTPRVVERMQEVSTTGNSVWDRECCPGLLRAVANSVQPTLAIVSTPRIGHSKIYCPHFQH